MKHDQDFIILCEQALSAVKEISILNVEDHLEKNTALVIDVREDHEWEKGHLPGAQHLGRGILERDIATLINDKSASIVLYCGGGYRSALSAHSLQLMGYSNIYSMRGGVRAWREANLPWEVD
ncbi:MAG: sulfurtransferase [Coxiellaceae bacterium]|nr:sulfurtransferase [Coxiellaceae bacterium]|tara:strand:- start:4084 stop:4452 length:369 start_codon:yes stop_codon:yes gene_type:complete